MYIGEGERAGEGLGFMSCTTTASLSGSCFGCNCIYLAHSVTREYRAHACII